MLLFVFSGIIILLIGVWKTELMAIAVGGAEFLMGMIFLVLFPQLLDITLSATAAQFIIVGLLLTAFSIAPDPKDLMTFAAAGHFLVAAIFVLIQNCLGIITF